MYDAYGLFINGAWITSEAGAGISVLDPATEEVLGRIPRARPEHLDAALEAARTGFAGWRAVAAWERSAILRQAAGLVRERVEDIAHLMTREGGKPLAEARGETRAAADVFDWFADEARRTYGQLVPSRSAAIENRVIFQPVGVVAAFTPWNFPALLPARKIAPALAAGCAIILKPAEETPGTGMALVQACHDAGVPPGVLNLVTGEPAEISEYLLASPVVRKVSLTGSVPVGKHLAALAARDLKRVSLELGGHAPVLVFPDADPVAAARASAAAKFRNAGQVCIAPTRFYVHESIFDAFADAFVAETRRIRIGNGLDEGVDMGPLANPRRLQATQELIEDATRRGARVATGGRRPNGFPRGYFFEPTVLLDTPPDARILHEEPFAPIAPLGRFRDFDEVMALANALPYGLAGYVFTRSMDTARRAAEALDVGMVGVNEVLLASAETPFGGVKDSGYGREGGALGIFEYVQPKYIKTNTQG